jgi:hypothetical protein
MQQIKTSHGILVILFCFFISLYFISWASKQIEAIALSVSPLSQTAAVSGAGSGMIAHYSFDEGGGAIAGDTSGNNNYGTLQNGATWTTGKIGGAISFDGTDDYVSVIPNSLFDFGTSQDFSISVWFKTSTEGGLNGTYTPYVISKGFVHNENHFNVGLDDYTSDHLEAVLGNSSTGEARLTGGSQDVIDKTWHHAVLSSDRDGATVLYVDGVQVDSKGVTNNANTTAASTPLIIGGASQSGYQTFGNFPGIIDDVLIYNRPLSASEVSELYNSGNGKIISPANDTTAPVISGVSSQTTPSSATITWTTNEPSDTQIEYGQNTSYGNSTSIDTSLSTNHSQAISNLSAETTYHYRVKSKDAAGNIAQSSDQIFITRAAIGATVTATSCSAVDVQQAINLASYGGTVIIPAGTCTWSNPVVMDTNIKPLTLKGSGWDRTIINAGVNYALSIIGSNDSSFFVSDMQFTGGVGNSIIVIYGSSKKWRLHDIKFNPNGETNRLIYINGDTYGLIDHNIVEGSNPSQFVTVDDTDWTSWQRPMAIGDNNAVYIENNTVRWSGHDEGGSILVDSERGGRVVFRYNNTTNGVVGNHGFDSGSVASSLRYEVYNNNFTIDDFTNTWGTNGKTWARLGLVRGGTGLWFNNRFNVGTDIWSGSSINLSIFRNILSANNSQGWGACDGTKQKMMCSNIDKNWNSIGGQYVKAGTQAADCDTGYVPKWKFCSASKMNLCTTDSDCPGGEICNGYVDGSTANGYICRMQPGTGSQNQPAPIYEWNNTLVGTMNVFNSDVDLVGEQGDYLKEGRDYFNDTCKPGYVPYTYPHPLTGLAPQQQPLNCGGGAIDTTPPVISSITTSSITTSSANISWITNEPSNSQIFYGLTTVYGSNTPLQTLTGLQSNTTYHYKIRATDNSNNTAESGDYTFSTLSTTSTDDDRDGISNNADLCSNSPTGSVVNSVGCPLPKMSKFNTTTNLNTDLRSVSSFDVGNTYGKIVYTPSSYTLIKATGEPLDIDSNLSIVQGLVSLDSTNLIELNRPATITLYNIRLNKPSIKKNNYVCSTCTLVSYNSTTKTLIFTVPGFSTFSVVEEEPSTTRSNSSGSRTVTNTPPPLPVSGSSAYNFGLTTLKSGSTGEAVMELQRFLNRFLNLGLLVDGKLGPKTIAVIKKWQKENGLVADGLVGEKTKTKMNAMAL